MVNHQQEKERADQPKPSPSFSEALSQCLKTLAAVYRAEVTETMAMAYSVALSDFNGPQIIRATKHLLKTHLEYMPTPAQIIKSIEDSMPTTPMNHLLPEPDLDREEVQKILAEAKAKIPWLKGRG